MIHFVLVYIVTGLVNIFFSHSQGDAESGLHHRYNSGSRIQELHRLDESAAGHQHQHSQQHQHQHQHQHHQQHQHGQHQQPTQLRTPVVTLPTAEAADRHDHLHSHCAPATCSSAAATERGQLPQCAGAAGEPRGPAGKGNGSVVERRTHLTKVPGSSPSRSNGKMVECRTHFRKVAGSNLVGSIGKW